MSCECCCHLQGTLTSRHLNGAVVRPVSGPVTEQWNCAVAPVKRLEQYGFQQYGPVPRHARCGLKNQFSLCLNHPKHAYVDKGKAAVRRCVDRRSPALKCADWQVTGLPPAAQTDGGVGRLSYAAGCDSL